MAVEEMNAYVPVSLKEEDIAITRNEKYGSRDRFGEEGWKDGDWQLGYIYGQTLGVYHYFVCKVVESRKRDFLTRYLELVKKRGKTMLDWDDPHLGVCLLAVYSDRKSAEEKKRIYHEAMIKNLVSFAHAHRTISCC